jgi:homotetrameric cytidine deaminase
VALARPLEAALPPDLVQLHRAAEEARPRAYAPYSGYQVGAAVRATDGSIVTGVNVENASFGLTICAERAAIFRALAEGHRGFDAVAVAGPGSTVSPCGGCRQVLAEFLPPDAPVIFPLEGQTVAVPLGELLPDAFGPDDVLSGR